MKSPWQSHGCLELLLFQLQLVMFWGDYSHGNQESHFQQFSAFFVFACALFHSKTWLFLPPWKETLSSVWGCSGSVLGRTCPGKGDVWGSLGRMAYGAGMLSSGSSACLEILHRKVSFHNALGHFQTALAVWVGMQAWCPRSLEAQQQWGLAH